jgi:hypothetical protein
MATVPSLGPAEWAALIAGAAWLGGIAFGLRLGWSLCVRSAERAAEEWDGEPAPGEVTGPILVTDLSQAAAIPGPMRPRYVPDPERVQMVPAVCDPVPEYRGQYREVWEQRPERLAAIDELVGIISARVLGFHELKRGLITEGAGPGEPRHDAS